VTTHKVTFDLDDLKRELDTGINSADLRGTDSVTISRVAWVMARSLCDQYEEVAEAAQEVVKEWDARGDGGCMTSVQEHLRRALG
jgi:hypothetical protein